MCVLLHIILGTVYCLTNSIIPFPGRSNQNVEYYLCVHSQVCVGAHSARRCCHLPVNQAPHDNFGNDPRALRPAAWVR